MKPYDDFAFIFLNWLHVMVVSIYGIGSKSIGVERDDELTDILPSTSSKVNLSFIFFATTLEFSISF